MTSLPPVPAALRQLGDFCLIRTSRRYLVVTPSGEAHCHADLVAAEKDLLMEFARELDIHNQRLVRALGAPR